MEIGTDSSWYDLIRGDRVHGYFSGNGEKAFLRDKIVIKNTTSDNDGINITGKGFVDLTQEQPAIYRSNSDMSTFINKWGNKGKLYLSAMITTDTRDYPIRAIYKANLMEYTRTISFFALEDSEDVRIITNSSSSQNVSSSENEIDEIGALCYAILYLALVIETIMFTVIYIKRVLQLAMLTMIAPLVALMYPVDKVGDGKAQAFNTWFKDYLFNSLIQPLHLLLYTIFIAAASELFQKNIVYALAIYAFMIPAEKYFKKIFGFDKASSGGGSPLAGALGSGLAMHGLGKLAGLGPRGGGPGGPGGPGRNGPDGGRKSKIRLQKRKPDSPVGAGDSKGLDGSRGSTGAGVSKGVGGSRGPTGAGAPKGVGGSRGSTGGGVSGILGSTLPLGTKGGKGAPNGALESSSGLGDAIGKAPNAKGTGYYSGKHPLASTVKSKVKSVGRSVGKTAGRRLTRAVTGGKYSSFKGLRKGQVVSATLGNLGAKAGRGLIRTGGRAIGTGLLGATGVMAGAATAIATGDVSNIAKGASIGALAGYKNGGRLANSALGTASSFRNEYQAFRADNDEAYHDKLRGDEAIKALQDDLAQYSPEDREKYVKTIRKYAPYVDLNEDSRDMVEALAEVDPNIDDNYSNIEEVVSAAKAASRFGNLTTTENENAFMRVETTEQMNKISDDEVSIEDIDIEEKANQMRETQINEYEKQKQKVEDEYMNRIANARRTKDKARQKRYSDEMQNKLNEIDVSRNKLNNPISNEEKEKARIQLLGERKMEMAEQRARAALERTRKIQKKTKKY